MFERNFIGLLPYKDRKITRDATIQWLLEQDFTHFVTFVANRGCSIEFMHDKLTQWLARVDRMLLGRNWERMGEKRTLLIGYVEKPDINIHVHAMARFPAFSEFSAKEALELWQKVLNGGGLDMQPVASDIAVATYITKDLNDRRLFGSFYISGA